MTDEIIPKGKLFTVSTGEYSDYTIAGVFETLTEIDTKKLRDEWLESHPEQRERYKFNDEGFLSDILSRGLIAQLECYEWHTSSYSSIDGMWARKLDS
jgi:hypothetical protein